MNKNFLALLLCGCVAGLHAQSEIKINPLGLLFSSPDISAEFAVQDNIGIEAKVGISYLKYTLGSEQFKSSGATVGGQGKYYFNPSDNIDGFYAGLYLRGGNNKFTSSVSATNAYSRTYFAGGLSTGYKWVSRNNIVFEIGGGLGKNFMYKLKGDGGNVDLASIPLVNIDGFIRLDVGYRFGGGGGKKR